MPAIAALLLNNVFAFAALLGITGYLSPSSFRHAPGQWQSVLTDISAAFGAGPIGKAERVVIHIGNLTLEQDREGPQEKLAVVRHMQSNSACNSTELAAAKQSDISSCFVACNFADYPQYEVQDQACSKATASSVCSCSSNCVCVKPGNPAGGIVVAILEQFFWVLLEFLVALCLWSSIQQEGQLDPIPQLSMNNDFESGICGCCDDCGICCCGFFCPIVRAAHTVYGATIWNFWPAMFLYGFVFMLPGVFGWAALAVVRYMHRSEFRRRAGLNPDPCCDIVCVCFCGPCTICQEARHLRKAQLKPKTDVHGVAPVQVVGNAVVMSRE